MTTRRTTGRATQLREATAAEPAAPAGGPAVFGGFPEAATAFYEGLEADNSKTYWADHKATYEQAVLAPMLALLATLEPEFGAAKLFRPYRDVRFSADKSPYKTHQGAVVGTGTAQGTLYVQLSADGLMLGGGCYVMSKDQLVRYRAAIEDDVPGRRLEAVVAGLREQGFELAGERLQRAPRGVDPSHPRVELLRHKGIAALQNHGAPGWLATPEAAERIADGWRAVSPLNAWLAAHVGAPEPVEGDPRPARRGVSPRGAGV
jgi:uncharacterized protein (TIGR02453 family)